MSELIKIKAIASDLYGTVMYIHEKEYKKETESNPYKTSTEPHKILFQYIKSLSKPAIKNKNLNPEIFEEKNLAKILQTNNYEDIREFISYLGLEPKCFRQLNEFEERQKKDLNKVRIISKGVENLLDAENLGYPTIAISNASTPYKQPFYLYNGGLGMDARFNEVIFSCDVGFRKPDIEIFQLAQERLKKYIPDIKPYEILMIGDEEVSDIQGAINAGWNATNIQTMGTLSETIGEIEKELNKNKQI